VHGAACLDLVPAACRFIRSASGNNWVTLAAVNPQWFDPDGTHLAINGTGADALAALGASALNQG